MATVTAPVPLPVIDGGTGSGSTLNAGGVLYAVTTTSVTSTSTGTSGFFLKSNAGAAPTWAAVGGVITGLTQNQVPMGAPGGANIVDSSIAIGTTGEMTLVSTSNISHTIAAFVDPTIPNGNTITLGVGRSISNQQAALIQFVIDNASAGSNYMQMGVFGTPTLMQYTQTGQLNIGSLTTITPLAQIYGGTGTTVGGTTTPTASTTVARDSQGNIAVNNETLNYAEFTCDGATHTLAASDAPYVKVTGGSTAGTIFILPSASTGGPGGTALPKGFSYTFDNNGSASITVQRSGGGAFFPSPPVPLTLSPQFLNKVLITSNTTPGGAWDAHFKIPNQMSVNYVIAGPSTAGGSLQPTSRALVTADFGPSTSGSTAKNVLVSAGSGATPTWTTIDLSSAAAVGTSVLGVANGGTGLSTIFGGNLLYTSGPNIIAGLTPGVAGNVLIASGVPAVPLWSTIDLAASTAVGSSVLPVANGGTGSANAGAASNDSLYFSSGSIISKNSAIKQYATGAQTWATTTGLPLNVTCTQIDTNALSIVSSTLTGTHYIGMSLGYTDASGGNNGCWQFLYRPQAGGTAATLTAGIPNGGDYHTFSATSLSSPTFISTANPATSYAPVITVNSNLPTSSGKATHILGAANSTNESTVLGFSREGANNQNSYAYLNVNGQNGIKVNGFGYASINAGAFFFYDEGTWSPTLMYCNNINVAITSPTITYDAANLGYWTRVGKKVNVSFLLKFFGNFVGNSNSVGIFGIPSAIAFGIGALSGSFGLKISSDQGDPNALIDGQSNPVRTFMWGLGNSTTGETQPFASGGTQITISSWTPAINITTGARAHVCGSFNYYSNP